MSPCLSSEIRAEQLGGIFKIIHFAESVHIYRQRNRREINIDGKMTTVKYTSRNEKDHIALLAK